jgi:hypothetical protein
MTASIALKERLLELHRIGAGIQAAAAAEQRDLHDFEQRALDDVLAEFDAGAARLDALRVDAALAGR